MFAEYLYLSSLSKYFPHTLPNWAYTLVLPKSHLISVSLSVPHPSLPAPGLLSLQSYRSIDTLHLCIQNWWYIVQQTYWSPQILHQSPRILSQSLFHTHNSLPPNLKPSLPDRKYSSVVYRDINQRTTCIWNYHTLTLRGLEVFFLGFFLSVN